MQLLPQGWPNHSVAWCFFPSVLFPDNHVDKSDGTPRKDGPPLVSLQLFAFAAAAGAFAGTAPAAAVRTTFSGARAAAGDASVRSAATTTIAALAGSGTTTRAGTATTLRAALVRDIRGLIECCWERG